MEDFKKLPKMACFKTGGRVAEKMCKGGKAYKEGGHMEEKEEAADIEQDKKIVKKAIRMHDEQEHEGEKTDLSKLRRGGRAKKEVGTVKKYKDGGPIMVGKKDTTRGKKGAVSLGGTMARGGEPTAAPLGQAQQAVLGRAATNVTPQPGLTQGQYKKGGKC